MCGRQGPLSSHPGSKENKLVPGRLAVSLSTKDIHKTVPKCSLPFFLVKQSQLHLKKQTKKRYVPLTVSEASVITSVGDKNTKGSTKSGSVHLFPSWSSGTNDVHVLP